MYQAILPLKISWPLIIIWKCISAYIYAYMYTYVYAFVCVFVCHTHTHIRLLCPIQPTMESQHCGAYLETFFSYFDNFYWYKK